MFTKVFTHRGTAVPSPAIGGGWKTDTHQWTPLPADNCLLVDCQVQPENCHGLSVPPTVIWTPARGPFNATNPCTIDVSYQLALPVARVEYRLHVRLAVPTLFRHPHFQEAYQNTSANQSFFGPGLYNRVENYGIEDNKVSSLLSA